MSQVSTTAYTNELSCSMNQYGTFQHAIQKYHWTISHKLMK